MLDDDFYDDDQTPAPTFPILDDNWHKDEDNDSDGVPISYPPTITGRSVGNVSLGCAVGDAGTRRRRL